MKVRQILEQKGNIVHTVQPTDTVKSAINKMNSNNVGGVVVVDDSNNPVGVLTERDILKRIASEVCDLSSAKVSDLMSRKIIVALPDDEIQYLMGVMTEKRIRHMPVMEDNKLVGIITIGDVVKAHLEKTRYEIHYLKEYISGNYPG